MEQREQGYLSEVKSYLDTNPTPKTWKQAAGFYKTLTGITDDCQKCNFYTYINALTALFNIPKSMKVETKLKNYSLKEHLKDESYLVFFGNEKVAIADLDDAFAERCTRAGLKWFDKVTNLEATIEDVEIVEEPIAAEIVEVPDETTGTIELN
jgi:hypothetical protein